MLRLGLREPSMYSGPARAGPAPAGSGPQAPTEVPAPRLELGSAPKGGAPLLKFEPNGTTTLNFCPVGNIQVQVPIGNDRSCADASNLISVSAKFLPPESEVQQVETKLLGRSALEQLCRGVSIEIIWDDVAGQGRELRRQQIDLGSSHFEDNHPEYRCTFGTIEITLVLHGEHGVAKGPRGWGSRLPAKVAA